MGVSAGKLKMAKLLKIVLNGDHELNLKIKFLEYLVAVHKYDTKEICLIAHKPVFSRRI